MNPTTFLDTHVLKAETCRAIEGMGVTAVQIANRWSEGWPKLTRRLERQGKLLMALQQQLTDEEKVDDYLRKNPHLSRLDALEVFELAHQGPPA